MSRSCSNIATKYELLMTSKCPLFDDDQYTIYNYKFIFLCHWINFYISSVVVLLLSVAIIYDFIINYKKPTNNDTMVTTENKVVNGLGVAAALLTMVVIALTAWVTMVSYQQHKRDSSV